MSSSIPPSTPGKPWQPPAPEELAPELPQYEILSLLGRGGMGAVYLARQKSLKREVAIKVLPPSIEDNDMSYGERFKAEAQVMARLNHPGIIAVYDAGETPSGLLYFVMEYVQGTDVHQMIASSGRLPPQHAHAITAHVCEALAYAHANGLIHRDIKPANIMVDMQGRVKVADFGLAKMANDDHGFTKSNMAVGTPDFVAPEALITGMAVDGRADLYAVGVMLYQMLTGQLPRGAWQPASVVVPGTDRRFDDIIIKAMQYDREARHSSAAEMRAHLDSLLMPVVAAPDLQHYSSAGMAKQSAPQASGPPPRAAAAAAAPRPPAPPPRTPVSAPAAKSKTPLFIGLGAAAAIGIGAFVMFSGGEKAKPSASPAPSGGTSVTSAPKPTPAPTRPSPPAPEPTKAESKAATPAPAATPAFPPGKWVKIDQTSLLSQSGIASDGWRNPTGPVTELPDLNWKNQGIRLKTRFTGATTGDAHFLELRRQKNPSGDLSSYQFMLSVSQKSFSVRLDTEESKNAQVIQPLSGHAMKPDTEVALEFAIVGSQIISRIDGQLQPLLTDTTLSSGYLGFRNVFPVHDIEVINLDGLSEAEALKVLGVKEKIGDLTTPAISSTPASTTPISKPQSPPPAAFPHGQWVKVFTKTEDLPVDLLKPDSGVKFEDGFLKPLPAKVVEAEITSAKGTRWAVRATLRRDPENTKSLGAFRFNGTKDSDWRRLTIPLASGIPRIEKPDQKSGGVQALSEFSGPVPIPVGKLIKFEFAYYNGLSVGRINDALLPVSKDELITERQLAVSLHHSIRDIEVINLDGLSEAEALRILGVDEKGNNIRSAVVAQEKRAAEQKQQEDKLSSIPELKTLHDQFLKLQAERVTAPFEADVAKLNTSYLGGLDRKIGEERGKGNLDGVLALEAEKQLIKGAGIAKPQPDDGTWQVPLPADEETTTETLKDLRKVYRDAFAKLATTRAANLKQLTDPLTVRLKQLESTLTQANRIDHAKSVREYREGLNQPTDGQRLEAPNDVSAPAASTRPDSISPKAAKVKADPKKSRSAAEYALKRGAEVKVEDRGGTSMVKTVEDLPKGNLALTGIYYTNQIRITLVDEDIASASRAAELEVFEVRESNTCKITSLTPFQNCPHLKRLFIPYYGALTSADCQALGSLTSLTSLSLPGGEPIADYNLLLGSKRCQELVLHARVKKVEEFAHIGACRDLTDLTINVTDPIVANEGIAHLGNLEKLEAFYSPQTPYSGPGMSKLSVKLERTITRLTFGKADADSSDAVEVAISKFPLLVEFHFRGEATAASVAQIKKLSALQKLTLHQATITPAHVSAISGCKVLTELTIGNGSLSSTDIGELKKLKVLRYLKIYDNGIQIDANTVLTALPQLKSLTQLDLPESQFNADQAAELRKLMPKCHIALIKRYD